MTAYSSKGINKRLFFVRYEEEPTLYQV
jgi:hypothetical protein